MTTSSELSPADELRALLRNKESSRIDLQYAAGRLGRATRKALQLMPFDVDVEELLQSVERYRGRPLYVLGCDLRGGKSPSAFWLTTGGGVDVVFVELSASLARRRALVCRELIRVLLDDQGEAEAAPVAAAVLAPDLAPAVVDRLLAGHD